MSNEDIRNQVKEVLTDYLNKHYLRKTLERYSILDHIYQRKDHFDIDSLFDSMIKTGFRISRATLYNTISLFMDCGLVICHQFGNNVAKYEIVYGNNIHDHLICLACGKVTEVEREETQKSNAKAFKKFEISYAASYYYGTCSKCAHAKKIDLNKKERDFEKKKSLRNKSDK